MCGLRNPFSETRRTSDHTQRGQRLLRVFMVGAACVIRGVRRKVPSSGSRTRTPGCYPVATTPAFAGPVFIPGYDILGVKLTYTLVQSAERELAKRSIKGLAVHGS